jgi:hypothetical protein
VHVEVVALLGIAFAAGAWATTMTIKVNALAKSVRKLDDKFDLVLEGLARGAAVRGVVNDGRHRHSG